MIDRSKTDAKDKQIIQYAQASHYMLVRSVGLMFLDSLASMLTQ